MREVLESATLQDKGFYFEMLDVRGKLAVENGERVICVKCKIGKQRVSTV